MSGGTNDAYKISIDDLTISESGGGWKELSRVEDKGVGEAKEGCEFRRGKK